MATEDYFRALGVPLVRGRFFTPRDNMDAPAPVVIINRAMAQAYWPGEDPLGKRFSFEDHPKKDQDWMTVVAVVVDTKDQPNSAAAEPAFWWPFPQMPVYPNEICIVARGQAEPGALAAEIRAAVASLDPQLAVANLNSWMKSPCSPSPPRASAFSWSVCSRCLPPPWRPSGSTVSFPIPSAGEPGNSACAPLSERNRAVWSGK